MNMYTQVGRKLKICAYIFVVLFSLKSICYTSCRILTIDSIWKVLNDLLLAFIIAMFIYGYGYIIHFYENKRNQIMKDNVGGG